MYYGTDSGASVTVHPLWSECYSAPTPNRVGLRLEFHVFVFMDFANVL